MYRRYTNMGRENGSPNQIKQIRIRDIIIVLLLAGLAFLAFKAIPAFRYQDEEKTLFVRRMISECNEAVDALEKELSPYNNGKTEETLAKIRSNLYAIRALNDIHTTQQKKELVSADLVSSCVKAVDNYMSDISVGGKNTTNLMNELRLSMDQLKNELAKLD